MEILIRPVKTEEFEELAELTNSAYAIPYKPGMSVTRANDSADKIKEEMADGAKIFVAELNNEMVGAIRTKVSGKTLLPYKLAVSVNFMKKGIGSQLVKYIFKYGESIGLDKAVIEVAEDKGLIPYYKSFGFTLVKRYLHNDHYEVQMEKQLSTNSVFDAPRNKRDNYIND